VANSERTASRLRGLVPDEQLVVVPNGIDLDRFARERPARAANAPVVFGMVANLTTRWKKHALLLEAIAAANLPPSEVRFYGHGDRSDAYVDALHVRAAQLAVPVSFPGHAADPAAIMRELDVLVHPADHESFGRVVVEAMAAALPVVGVRGGGVGEIVVDGETGLLAPPDDATALGAAMARVAADPALRARLGAAGRRRAHDLYSIDACADGVLAAYRRAVTRPVGWRDLLFAKGAA
jgi:glycosyltransferase involved in cell wall biosynthesis